MTEPDAFQAAADYVEESIRLGEETFAGDAIKLKLYGLYKQALFGSVQEPQPSLFHPKQRSKWNAWKSVSALSQEEAKRQYIELVTETSPDWATTTEEKGHQGTGPVFSRLAVDHLDDASASAHETSEVVCRTPTRGCSIKSCVQSKKALDLLVACDMDGDRWKEALKAEGKQMDVVDDELRNVLHWATDGGHVDAVRALLQMQIVDVNSQDNEQMTPLHYASLCEHQEVLLSVLDTERQPLQIARLLVANGARWDIEDASGETPSNMAPSHWEC